MGILMAHVNQHEAPVELFPRPRADEVADYVIGLTTELGELCDGTGLTTVAEALRVAVAEARRVRAVI
jgi:hypothetical protein